MTNEQELKLLSAMHSADKDALELERLSDCLAEASCNEIFNKYSFYGVLNGLEVLVREEFHRQEIKTKKLRDQCERAGLDTRKSIWI